MRQVRSGTTNGAVFVPAVLAGYLVGRGHTLSGVAVGYAVALVVLALAAAASLAWGRDAHGPTVNKIHPVVEGD